MSENEDEERLDALRKRLDEIHHWPSIYMFKFVIPNDPEKVKTLIQIFGESAEFRWRESGKGNYVAGTIRAMMLNADQIFDFYREASKIEGIISL
ncbi:MAG: DUF493 family protein [Cryomorphaceae bacterium]|nr:DUF493 family protein [Cryomorphaceae bacterium]